MIFSKLDSDKWMKLALLHGKRFFRLRKEPVKTSNGTEGVTTTQVFKDGSGVNKTLTIIEGIITDIS